MLCGFVVSDRNDLVAEAPKHFGPRLQSLLVIADLKHDPLGRRPCPVQRGLVAGRRGACRERVGGVGGPSLRLHTGLENVEDLKADLARGFAAFNAAT